ncbi:MAG TPA: hypothetical protein VEY67_11360 [Candidatus Dormibacteraeota bacterium]|nr:hypothetical protein [Candidatus Dormibacteraeota bacterium]
MARPTFSAAPARSGYALDPAARVERTLVGAAMTVMAFVLERRLSGLSRGRSLASS